jgi:hypothetical protein
MITLAKKAAMSLALGATALTGTLATTAEARPYYGGGYHHGGGDYAGAAIAGGILGLAVGAMIASSHHDRGDVYYRDGAYYDRDGYRCDRDGHRIGDNGYYRRGYGNDGYDGQGYGRGDYPPPAPYYR